MNKEGRVVAMGELWLWCLFDNDLRELGKGDYDLKLCCWRGK